MIERASDAIIGRTYSGADPGDAEPTFEQGRKDAIEGFQPRLFSGRRRQEVRIYVNGWQAGRVEYVRRVTSVPSP